VYLSSRTSPRRAAVDGRLQQATSYLRVAEFFTPPRSSAKAERYRRYRELFDIAFTSDGLTRHEVPYVGATLPAYRLPAVGPATGGTAIVHGGFDSLIEEFYAIWQRLARSGFDVIAFEGPGQGGARTLGGLTFDHDWEKPVGAVLDHFRLEMAGLVGISMGGYWALRATGREPRINRVVCWPPVYDWLYRLPTLIRGPARAMLRRRRSCVGVCGPVFDWCPACDSLWIRPSTYSIATTRPRSSTGFPA
jgi:pimeloyl-ACP methyl ester carboxylesterase